MRVNPVYLPAPHEVLRAFFTAFTTPPRLPNEPWLHESLGHSIRTIFLGFLISSLLGVPLGILCGTYRFFARLQEPFIEFFRYLPAPAFGALCVAILGIDDGPKIAIIVIGTFFQQVLVIANTVRKVDPALVEAAQTLGARGLRLVRRVIIPASITDIYTDMRILLGWAWTYLIVAEVVGTMSGITFFINQQARYRNFDNVYAAIMMIGIIGLTTDMLLAWFGKVLFPWKRRGRAVKQAPLSVFAGGGIAVAGSPEQSHQSSRAWQLRQIGASGCARGRRHSPATLTYARLPRAYRTIAGRTLRWRPVFGVSGNARSCLLCKISERLSAPPVISTSSLMTSLLKFTGGNSFA